MSARPRTRLTVLAAVAAASMLASGSAAFARSGVQLYSGGGVYGVSARASLHHTTLQMTSWRCHYGATFGGTFGLPLTAKPPFKVPHSGRFNAHVPMHYEFENLQHESEESEQIVTVAGRFQKNGTIKLTMASPLCDGGKPQPFTLHSTGFAV